MNATCVATKGLLLPSSCCFVLVRLEAARRKGKRGKSCKLFLSPLEEKKKGEQGLITIPEPKSLFFYTRSAGACVCACVRTQQKQEQDETGWQSANLS